MYNHVPNIFMDRNLRALEPCCGNRREWSKSKPAFVVHGDKLVSVLPDAAMDFCALPFRDGVFDIIYFDPPHLIRSKSWKGALNSKYQHFGQWQTRAQWEAVLDAVNAEFYRVTRGAAELHVKIIDGKDRRVTKEADLDRLTNWRLTAIDRSKSKVTWSSCMTIRATYART